MRIERNHARLAARDKVANQGCQILDALLFVEQSKPVSCAPRLHDRLSLATQSATCFDASEEPRALVEERLVKSEASR
jgi:hypothetical protein